MRLNYKRNRDCVEVVTKLSGHRHKGDTREMNNLSRISSEEFISGQEVEPGTYLDIEAGTVIHVQEKDFLPEGRRVIEYTRKFRKIEQAA